MPPGLIELCKWVLKVAWKNLDNTWQNIILSPFSFFIRRIILTSDPPSLFIMVIMNIVNISDFDHFDFWYLLICLPWYHTHSWFWVDLILESFIFLRGPMILENNEGTYSFWGELEFLLYSEWTYMNLPKYVCCQIKLFVKSQTRLNL